MKEAQLRHRFWCLLRTAADKVLKWMRSSVYIRRRHVCDDFLKGWVEAKTGVKTMGVFLVDETKFGRDKWEDEIK